MDSVIRHRQAVLSRHHDANLSGLKRHGQHLRGHVTLPKGAQALVPRDKPSSLEETVILAGRMLPANRFDLKLQKQPNWKIITMLSHRECRKFRPYVHKNFEKCKTISTQTGSLIRSRIWSRIFMNIGTAYMSAIILSTIALRKFDTICWIQYFMAHANNLKSYLQDIKGLWKPPCSNATGCTRYAVFNGAQVILAMRVAHHNLIRKQQ